MRILVMCGQFLGVVFRTASRTISDSESRPAESHVVRTRITRYLNSQRPYLAAYTYPPERVSYLWWR